jgi:hypothetical protein
MVKVLCVRSVGVWKDPDVLGSGKKLCVHTGSRIAIPQTSNHILATLPTDLSQILAPLTALVPGFYVVLLRRQCIDIATVEW